MADWWNKLFGRQDDHASQQHQGDSPDAALPDTALPDTALPDTALPDTATPDAQAPQPASDRPLSLDEARTMAQQFLDDSQVASRLPPEAVARLRGLLADAPTEEQITDGMRTLSVAMNALIGQRIPLTQAQFEELQSLLVDWIQLAPRWDASRLYLTSHADPLLSDGAIAVLAALAQVQQSESVRRIMAVHQRLLRDARATGIDTAYDASAGELPQQPYVEHAEERAEINRLLRELLAIDVEREPTRAEPICRQILTLDEGRQLLSAHNRVAVRGLLGNALRRQGGQTPGEESLHLLGESALFFRAALEALGGATSTPAYAGIQNGLGNTLQMLAGRIPGEEGLRLLEEATHAFRAALTVFHPDTDTSNYAGAQLGLGNTLRGQAERMGGEVGLRLFAEAVAAYRAALAAFDPAIEPLDYAGAQMGLGNTLSIQARRTSGEAALRLFTEAVAAYHAALAAFDPATSATIYAGIHLGLGNTVRAQAEIVNSAVGSRLLDEAITAYRTGLTVLDPAADALMYTELQNGLGNALVTQAVMAAGEARSRLLEDAATAYRAALAALDPATDRLACAQVHNGLGAVLELQAEEMVGEGRLRLQDQAIVSYQDALEGFPVTAQPDEHRRRAHVLARALLRRALASERAGSAREQALERASDAISSALEAARALALREALVSFRQQEWAENARVFTLAAAIAALRGAALPTARRDHLAQAVTLLEEGRARGLAEAAGRRSAQLDLLAAPDRERYIQAVEAAQAIEAQSRQAQDPLALAAEARAADERLKEIVRDLRSRYQGFLPEPDTSLPALTRGLTAGEALVYLMPLEPGTLLLAVGPTGEPVMRWLGELTSDAIFDLAVQPNTRGVNRCGYLPAALGWGETPLDQTLDALLPQLGDELMREVVRVVRELGCHRAVLVAGGYLSVMPLHAASYPPLAGEPATAPDGRRYACDDVAFTYAPSALTLLGARATAQRQAQAWPARRALVVGNPQLTRQGRPWVYDRLVQNGYLRFAELEASRVAALADTRIPPFQVNLAANDAATWSAVRDGLRTADLAHLSLHARFDAANPEQSALLVAFRSSLYLRDLLQTTLPRLRLVVLSACQSGLSDVQRQSEEAVGLFGALLAAGTPAVIGTLWSVNDLATAHFMESFARRAYRDGVAPDAALRSAARELRGLDDEGATPPTEPTSEAAEPAQPQNTPAREAIARDRAALEREPDLIGATRLLSGQQMAVTVQQLDAYRTLLKRGPEHPVYWAAFVYYGVPVSLAGGIPSGPADAATLSREGAVDEAQSDAGDERSEHDATPIATTRADEYFPAASEVCPRCHAEDSLPVTDPRGRALRQCVSCGLRYAPSGDADSSVG